MNDNRKPAESDSVDHMLKELADWFTTPVAPHTPDHVLDEILERITTDDSETVSEEPGIDHRLSHLRDLMRRVNEDMRLRSRKRHVYPLAPLTDWTTVRPTGEPIFRMLLQEIDSEAKAVLEIARAGAHPAHDSVPWAVSLKRYADTRDVAYAAPWERLLDAVDARLAPGFVLLFVDEGMNVTAAELHDMGLQKVRSLHGEQRAARKEEILLSVIREVLGREEVAPQDDLLQLGVDSVLCAQIAQAAKQRGLKIPVSLFMQSMSVAELAGAAQETEPDRSSGGESGVLLGGLSRFATPSAARPPSMNFLVLAAGSFLDEEPSRPAAAQSVASVIASLIK